MLGKRKYSEEFKLTVVMDYLSGKSGGFETIANKYGIHHSMVERWVHKYELHGTKGLANTSGGYSGEFKLYVVEYMHAKNMSLTGTANHFCIQSDTTVARWERIYYEEGPEALLEEC